LYPAKKMGLLPRGEARPTSWGVKEAFGGKAYFEIRKAKGGGKIKKRVKGGDSCNRRGRGESEKDGSQKVKDLGV